MRRRQCERYRKERKKNAPKPLGRRRRELSPASSKRKEQTKSLLLSRLPLEIRLQIYEYVLGGELIHLVQIPKRIALVHCQLVNQPGNCQRFCCPPAIAKWPTNYSDNAHMRRPSDNMGYYIFDVQEILRASLSNANFAFLRTCRQVYMEAINIPYSSNIFEVDDLTTLLYFSQTIRSQRLSQIKHLQIRWEFFIPPMQAAAGLHHPQREVSHSDDTWVQFWQTVATKMTGLSHLSLRMEREQGDSNVLEQKWDARWVTPLLKVYSLKTFDLVISTDQIYDESSNENMRVLVQYLRENMCNRVKEVNGHPMRRSSMNRQDLT